MSRPSAVRAILAALAVVLGGVGPSPVARAQKDRPPVPVTDPVRLPEDVQARQKLAAAEDYVKAQAWPEATRLIQALLDARDDSFRRRTSAGGRSAHWTSVRGEAERLLAELPAAGRDFYRLTYEARARKGLAAARAGGDPVALHDVARRYGHTAAGAEALERLGSYHLDRGQADLADVCFRRLLRHPGADRLAPVTLFKAALASRAAGGRPGAAWQKLVERLGNGRLQLGADAYDVTQLQKILDGWPGRSTDDNPLFRGDAARSARGHGEVFLLEPRWRAETAEGDARSRLVRAVRSSPRAVLPAATPLALDGRLIYRAADGLRALDAATGRLLWRSPSPLSLTTVLADVGLKVHLDNKWLPLYGPAAALLVENSTLGTLSSDGRRVYAVEDLPVPPPPQLLQNDNGAPSPLGPMRYHVGHNRLRAVEADTGRPVWEAGGPAPAPANAKADTLLTGAYFLGPPLPLGGELFALVEKQQELHLVCLDAERGRPRWSQMLATAREKMETDVVRHTQAAHLAYADGVLVCPTHAGAVLGFDPLSRGLLWAHVYAKPPVVRDDGMTEPAPAALVPGWRACAPVVSEGRIVLAPPDGDAVYCLGLHDGELLWKATRTEDDLYVGCVHRRAVLVVGRTACRMVSLDSGATLWRGATGQPAGLGVHDGPVYHLPLREGAVLSLNLERPGEWARAESRAVRGELGNLVFHRGTLWSQNATELMALTTLTARLAGVEQRLAKAPGDPVLLVERGRLHLNHGDLAAAAADLHAALRHDPPASLRPAARALLFEALTKLLRQDFAAGEKYLDEYRDLCRVPIPASAGTESRRGLEAERDRRQTQMLALVALGREKQGRPADALAAYRELVRRGGEPMPDPDDPDVRTRPDLWAQGRVASLVARAGDPKRQLLADDVRREGRAIAAGDRAALRRFVALYNSVEGDAGAPAREARLRLAAELARSSGRRHALEAELLLHGFADGRALDERARLLTRHGLLGEAVACYRQLARDYPGAVVHDGKTGSQILDALRGDKRFLAHLEPKADPWAGAKLRPVLLPRGQSAHPLHLPCVPCRVRLPGGRDGEPSFQPVGEIPESLRRLRLTLDGSRLQLRVADRATGAELYAVPLPLTAVPPALRDQEVGFQAVDHLVVLCVGPTLLGVDLLERRVRWVRPVLDGGVPPGAGLLVRRDDVVLMENATSSRGLGLVGPVGPAAVCVQTLHGLVALDPASGEVCWSRAHVPRDLLVFGDEEVLFLVEKSGEGGVRSVQAVRARDGASLPTPDAIAACANTRRILGRLLLVEDAGPDGRPRWRLHDPLTGDDLWRRSAPAGSFLLHSPSPRWLGVVEPDGTVAVADLARREDVARLHLDPRHLDKVRGGSLLVDREQFYVALQGPIDPDLKVVGEPTPGFRSGLVSVPVHGMLYAFGRPRGELRWFSWVPLQALLVEQFEDLPILLCSAFTQRAGPGTDNAVSVLATRSLDKRTGKLLHNREAVVPTSDLFHTLRLDPYGGPIDLVGTSQTLRHRR